jgi:hypothetical protein
LNVIDRQDPPGRLSGHSDRCCSCRTPAGNRWRDKSCS